MKFIKIFLFTILITSCTNLNKEVISESESVTVYYLIRHAEKDRSDPLNKDPELTDEGMLRAKKWAEIFEHVQLDQIYTTEYKRTQQTTMYVATQQNVAVETYSANNLYNDEFKAVTIGETVLIVGHSNTTPAFVNAIIGEAKYSDIDDANNGSLYIVTIFGNTKNVQLLNMN